jgi:hypothetical protein
LIGPNDKRAQRKEVAMKKVFWVLVMGAAASAAMAIGLGRAEVATGQEIRQQRAAG